MFSSSVKYAKLKTNLRLAINRLKLLEKKKSEQAQKARKEIADYISDGKYERAKIRVEHIIREDYMVEALELLEMYCDLLLSRFGMVQEMKGLDPSLAEAISSILWSTPRVGSEIDELKVIAEQLSAKYGKPYADTCKNGTVNTISEKLRHKMSIQAPPKILVEKYLIEIAKIYNINYEPDPQVMREHEQSKGMDALLFEPGTANNLDNVRPPGFIDFPPAPLVPENRPFDYPSKPSITSMPEPNGPAPGAPMLFSYNIPPSNAEPPPYDGNKTINTNKDKPSMYPPALPPNQDTNKQVDDVPKPMPRSKMSSDMGLPDLPSVPNDCPLPSTSEPEDSDGDDFKDIARRFQELNKKK